MRPSITERQEQNLRLLYDPACCPPGYRLGRGDKDAIGAAPGEIDRPRAGCEDCGGGAPVGSCDDCGVNLHGDEHAGGLCDQCSWARSRG